MFYEEKVVFGVLCSRTAPDVDWTPLTPQQLTNRLLEARGGHEWLVDGNLVYRMKNDKLKHTTIRVTMYDGSANPKDCTEMAGIIAETLNEQNVLGGI